MIGESRPLLKIFHMIHKLAKVDTSVLIRGESGTGKELVARALHFNSSRRKNNFVAVNCAAIPDHLLESELFGYERGAFTGADKKKLGKFTCNIILKTSETNTASIVESLKRRNKVANVPHLHLNRP